MRLICVAKIRKLPIALAALLAILLLVGRLSPATIVDGIIKPSGMLVTCAADTEQHGFMRVVEWAGLSLAAIIMAFIWAILGQILGGTFGGGGPWRAGSVS